MSDVRTDPLTPEEIASVPRAGVPVPDPRARRRAGRGGPRRRSTTISRAGASRRQYELTDPIIESSHGETRRPSAPGRRRAVAERDEVEKKPHSVPFLFNLWERDERFWKIDSEPGDRRHGAAAAGLGGGRPDGGRRRDQEAGRRRQARLAPGLRVLAARDARPRSRAGSRSTTSAPRTAGCRSPPGSHKLGEKLPGRVRRRQLLHARRAPRASARCRPPEEAGLEVVGYELKAGECGFHHALIWHASGPNTSQNPRRGFIPRYVAGGTIWLGAVRFPYNYTDAELECAPGRADPRPALPAHRDGVLIGRRALGRRARHAPRDAPPVVGVGRHLDALLLRVAEEAAQPADVALVRGERDPVVEARAVDEVALGHLVDRALERLEAAPAPCRSRAGRTRRRRARTGTAARGCRGSPPPRRRTAAPRASGFAVLLVAAPGGDVAEPGGAHDLEQVRPVAQAAVVAERRPQADTVRRRGARGSAAR